MLVNMAIIYGACVAGAIGLAIALPKRGSRLALLGSIIAGAALGAAFIALLPQQADAHASSTTAAADRPGILFYILAFIAAGGAIRMITHARPLYAALYFILVIIASAGLFLLLSAEFMAFALIIVYAGAILITYLFVIMLAQETPDESDWQKLADYDMQSHEPIAAVLAGFILLAALLGVAYQGIESGAPPFGAVANNHGHDDASQTILADPGRAELALMPAKVERALADADLLPADATVQGVDSIAGIATVILPTGEIQHIDIPDDLRASNVESIGLSMFNDFPVSLELAGVILFMAMLGAVVLARKPSVANSA